jgi:hypothetical protein
MLDIRVERLDSGIRRNDGVSELNTQVLRKISTFILILFTSLLCVQTKSDRSSNSGFPTG